VPNLKRQNPALGKKGAGCLAKCLESDCVLSDPGWRRRQRGEGFGANRKREPSVTTKKENEPPVQITSHTVS